MLKWLDYSKGFGGKYGVASENKDKSASNFDEEIQPVGTNYQRTRVDSKADIKGLKNRFESHSQEEESKRRAEELRQERLSKDKLEKELELVYLLCLCFRSSSLNSFKIFSKFFIYVLF
jgi:hypothetical protein